MRRNSLGSFDAFPAVQMQASCPENALANAVGSVTSPWRTCEGDVISQSCKYNVKAQSSSMLVARSQTLIFCLEELSNIMSSFFLSRTKSVSSTVDRSR